MSIIVSDLTFGYDGSFDNVFENISLQISTDWKLGFVGRNGRGKTTFLHLLMGKYEYKGIISSDVTFDYFPFDISDRTLNTLDIIEQIAPEAEFWEICRELSLLEVENEVLYRPFNSLTGGEQTKAMLCALFLKQGNFLLIDEPTNHLDMHGREIVSRYLNSKQGFILVSHDRIFLDNCVDHILSINKVNIEIQQGTFSSWIANKEMQDNFELTRNEHLKKDISKLSESAKQKAGWADKIEKGKIGTHAGDRGYIGHKSAKMMKRAKAVENRKLQAIEEKQGLLKNIEQAPDLAIYPLAYHKPVLARMIDVSISYEKEKVTEGVSLEIRQGERIAISGKNGSGKSSILKLFCKDDISYDGIIEIGSGLCISYISQNTSFLKGDLGSFARENKIEQSLFMSILRKLDFSREQFEKDMLNFSEGQKKKVLIAKSLCDRAHLYIWDEPLNFIDIYSRIQIESLLLTYQPTMLFVEHDMAFMKKIATEVIKL